MGFSPHPPTPLRILRSAMALGCIVCVSVSVRVCERECVGVCEDGGLE